MIWQQHTDPITFLTQIEQESGWRKLLLIRLGTSIGVILLLALLALLNQTLWREIIGYALMAFVPLASSIILPVGSSYPTSIRFWLTYLVSPPWLLIILLCGLLPLTACPAVSGIGITELASGPYLLIGCVVIPIAVGATVAVAGAVWMYYSVRLREREQLKKLPGGLLAELPHLSLWNRVRLLRIGLAAMGFLGGILLLLLYRQESLPVVLMAFIFSLACLRLEASLLSWTFPLVTYDREQTSWHTTYCGRFALFVPQHKISALIAPSSERWDDRAAEIVLALLRESTLAPTVRRAIAMLTPTEAHCLLLHLSLQAGGATAIRYLQPALPLTLRPIASQYADLATEAAKPLHLQLWLRVLPKDMGGSNDPSAASVRRLLDTLTQVRQTLLSYEHSPIVESTHHHLQQFVEELYGPIEPVNLPLSWPVALLRHVESRSKKLKRTVSK